MTKIISLVSLMMILISSMEAQGFREPLEAGSVAPEFQGKDQFENIISLSGILDQGRSVVLIFYRGSWCPYCEKHLSRLQDSLQILLDADADVVVVSPELPESAGKIIGATGAEFSILHDDDYSIMKDYQVDFVISDKTVVNHYDFVAKHTAEANGNEEGFLPVPATYIISPDGRIKWVHFDPDYKKRASIAQIVEALND